MSDARENMFSPPRYSVLKGPNGLRAGWRLLIFFGILIPLCYGVSRSVGPLIRHLHVETSTPLWVFLTLGVLLPPLLIASWIMAKIEGRNFADYGLPWRRAFLLPFWQGAVFSFASFTILLLAMRLAGAFSFGPISLHGFDVWRSALAWSVPLFLSALLEDFTYRGYLLFTLTTGIGFWPAAIVTSVLMGGMHYFNPAGHGLGPVAATMYCLVTCLVLRRTGDLWMPLGIHAAWNWAEVYFYGVPDSGFPAVGHFFNGNFHGSLLLTGGGFGPEASIFNLILLASWGMVFSVWLRGVKYPRPGSVQKK